MTIMSFFFRCKKYKNLETFTGQEGRKFITKVLQKYYKNITKSIDIFLKI